MKKIKVVVKYPGYPPKVEEVDNTLNAYERIVGGYIERVPVSELGVVYLVNDEGRLQRLKNNISFGTTLIVGPIIAIAETNKDYKSLNKEQINNVILSMQLSSL